MPNSLQEHILIRAFAEVERRTGTTSNAAGVVEQQITTIMDLGAKIQELLKVEQALERAMAGIAGSEEFRLAFSQLREHLATTDEFCRRLSKPRVITLHEEVIS